MKLKMSCWLTIIMCFTFSDTHENWLAQGKKYITNKQYTKAVECFREITQQTPDHFDANYHLFECYVQLSQNKKAILHLQKACAKQPSYNLYWKLGNFAEKSRDDISAEKAYRNCLLYGNNPLAYRRLSIVLDAQGKQQEAWKYRVQGVELELPKVRGFSFKKHTPAGVKNRQQLQKFLMTELDKELSAKDAETYMLTLLAFDMIPKPLDIKSLYISLLTEQVGGFYNPETKKLYLIAENKQPSIWEQWFPLTRNDANDRMVLAHEMTHAIQDQYFDLIALQKKAKSDDDMSLALTSLIEGDATIAMLDYNQWPKRVKPEDGPAFRATFQFMTFLMPFMGGDQLSKCPRIMREGLMFPYMDGFFFCLHLRQSSLWKQIDAAYLNPPKSSEQILHPRKYGIDEPLDFVIDHSELETSHWKVRASNVMGEFGIRCFLQDLKIDNYEKVAAGWGGDRYFLMQNSQDKTTALVWLTVWDHDNDAVEFLQAFEKINSKSQKFATIYREKFVFVTKNITPQIQASLQKIIQKQNNTKTK
ncbi:tetratricopeptide repeat protein [Candidatus Uabimicrobium amorphum]|uniref:Lipopolysaccharide assembly protein B n=1 Tax=Uabimicrobium amorphum TaxID=2596890 RepID=A0A5S9F4G7_UABAM|nr:tetratricopeptide repeat protein [Candidatus Uabimicrobium amorphum]BBM85532.1 lipopolysaccharide assembly protein B [Candidatus Uabimicrobium amorphum]